MVKFFSMEINIWKLKSAQKAKEIKELKKRVIELKSSRDLWKEKFMTCKLQLTTLENSQKKTRNLIEKIVFQDI